MSNTEAYLQTEASKGVSGERRSAKHKEWGKEVRIQPRQKADLCEWETN